MTMKIAAAAAALVLTASAAFAQGVEVKNSELYQLSVADYYVQWGTGSGDQDLRVNDVSGKVKIENSLVVQYNETDLLQANTNGDQTMYVNRIHGE